MEKIKWMDWSPEAFERAKKEDKLVLLDIGAVWCHWCHVMDQEAYSNPDIIRTVNEGYVPVRVDNDERPDVNERYNQGGWPTTVVMTPEGLVVYGATYLPPPSMKELLHKSREWYARNKQKIAEASSEAAMEMADGVMKPLVPAGPIKDFSEAIIEDIRKNADPVLGGFGTTQKFPYPGAISLALAEHHMTGEPGVLEFVEKTLHGMAEGLLDAEEGGLYRYSVTRDWKEPHYEKNLDVNTACLRNFLDAYRVTGKKEYSDAAEKIIGYMLSTLSDPERGGFFGSQDADIFDEGNQKILMDGEEYFKLPLAERKKHRVPYIDKTIYTNWNALAVSSFLDAHHALGREDCLDFALKTLGLLMQRCYSEEHGAYHFLRDGKVGGPGLLTDSAALAHANLDAYETTGRRKYLDSAERLMNIVDQRLRAEDGGYYDSLPDENMPPAARIRHRSLNDNTLAAETLARLHAYTAKTRYLDRSKAALAVFERNVEALLADNHGYFAADYALAARYVNDETTRVAIIGPKDDRRSRDLVEGAKRAYRPAKVVQLLDPVQDMAIIRTMNYVVTKTPTAYVCNKQTCGPPVTGAEELQKALAAT